MRKTKITNEIALRCIPKKITTTKRKKKIKLGGLKWKGSITRRKCKTCNKITNFEYIAKLGHSRCIICGCRNIWIPK
jgi:hypothetical protein